MILYILARFLVTVAAWFVAFVGIVVLSIVAFVSWALRGFK